MPKYWAIIEHPSKRFVVQYCESALSVLRAIGYRLFDILGMILERLVNANLQGTDQQGPSTPGQQAGKT